jgi:hypothetical protein
MDTPGSRQAFLRRHRVRWVALYVTSALQEIKREEPTGI